MEASSAQIVLSVIIPAYNAAETIGEQLTALARQTFEKPWEVIVADNGSTDQTVAVAESFHTKIGNLKIVDASGKQGAAYARNVGANAAVGNGIAFCDADDVVGEGWVAAIFQGIESHGFVASRFDIKRLNSGWVVKNIGGPQHSGIQQYVNPPYLPHAGGSGLGVRRDLHELVGGFDPAMRLLEDTDYCWRLQLLGHALHFAPQAVVHVRYRSSTRAIARQYRSWGKANVLLYKKYRDKGMPRYDWKSGINAWFRFPRLLARIRSKNALKTWWRKVNWRIGRLQGCWEYGVFAP